MFYITRIIGHRSVVHSITKCDLFGSCPVPVGGLIDALSSVQMHLLVPINILLLFGQPVIHDYSEPQCHLHIVEEFNNGSVITKHKLSPFMIVL